MDNSHIQLLAQKIKEKFTPQKIILFGSYANGLPDSSSDIDLLVIMETNEKGYKVAAQIRLYLDEILGTIFPMDILVRNPKEIEKRISEGDFFLQTVLAKGIVL